MNFSELPPSRQWAALKYRGEKFAEVWFKPAGEPCGLTFRIPEENFHVPGLSKQLTIETLLKAIGIAPEAVESWRHGDVAQAGMNGVNADLKNALPPPALHAGHLEIRVRLISPPAVSAGDEGEKVESSGLEVSPARWQDLEARWKSILGLEATLDALRISMEGLLTELERSLNKPLTLEEKNHGLRADISQWSKARNRIHPALPKLRDFIHRATWALGAPERKSLEEIYKVHIQPQLPFPQVDKVLKQLEELQKDRQVLSAHGKAVYQDCKGICADVQGALRTLQSNATANALRKKGASGSRRR